MRLKDHNTRVGTQPTFEYDFPDGFVLTVDTREQDVLFKRPPKGLVLVRDTLDVADYSIRGWESSIAVERKNLTDLYGSLGKNRERFKRELEILQFYDRRWIMVEASEYEVLCWQEYSQVHPNSIRQSLVSIEIRYGIPIYFFQYRKDMERKLLDLFVKYYRVKRGI